MIMKVSSSSSNGGRIGSDLTLSMSDQQKWQTGPPPHLLATAAASSGFPPQIRPSSSQGWLQKNGFHTLMRPS
jgi:AP2-like factor, euAP2 lineage